MRIDNVAVYGIDQSVRASKYPLSTDVMDVDGSVTSGVKARFKAESSSGEDVALQGIVVQMDLTVSKQMWAEMERYHFVDFVSSQSTMHRLAWMDPDEACNEYVDERAKELLRELISQFNSVDSAANADLRNKRYLRMIYSCPSGLELTARITTNYRQLKTIYKQRCHHRLPEWREFCDYVLTLPKFKEWCGV